MNDATLHLANLLRNARPDILGNRCVRVRDQVSLDAVEELTGLRLEAWLCDYESQYSHPLHQFRIGGVDYYLCVDDNEYIRAVEEL